MKKPKAYIEKKTTFCGLELYIDERVYVPTLETEILVEKASGFITANKLQTGVIIDVGTGSGNIALALASKFPLAKIIAIDVSEAALEVALYNKNKCKLSNVTFIESDLLNELNLEPDLIVANLPWGDDEHLLLSNTKEELSYMPSIAVFAQDGLLGAYVRLYKQIQSKNWHSPLIIETGCISNDSVLRNFDAINVIYLHTTYKNSQYSVTVIK